MACSNIRYGPGVTQEVGMDLINMGAKNVGVYTDKNLAGKMIFEVFSNHKCTKLEDATNQTFNLIAIKAFYENLSTLLNFYLSNLS
jgi:hypothetical protein